LQLHPDLAPLVTFRANAPGDEALIMDSWLTSYYRSPWAGVVPNNRYQEITREAVKQLRDRGAVFLVAARRDDPDQVLGWICFEALDDGRVVHYLYVKPGTRRMGVASELLRRAAPGGRDFYTFRTRASRYFKDWTWAPEIARRK
jgi:GNAT superfamily N-acetyltransferase